MILALGEMAGGDVCRAVVKENNNVTGRKNQRFVTRGGAKLCCTAPLVLARWTKEGRAATLDDALYVS
ncbi:MAG TPA: hypothetical protein VK358_11265, partial [Longimicrobium sp.]|nr:hypothetical protein [Longimicrobium sp.]